jgi:hypothetical protein
MISQKIIDDAVALIGRGYSQYEYFFSKLTSADWIPHLLERGFFREPPDSERCGDGGYWHRWPESQYLKRVADLDPAIVVKAFRAVPHTNNPFIHSDLVDAALKIPAAHAAELACIEREWIDSASFLGHFAHDHGKLIGHLARGGEAEEALEFARALLDIVPDPRYADGPPEEEDPESMEIAALPRPTNKIDHWYGEILQEDLPVLVTAAGVRAISLLADLLEKTIRLSSTDSDGAQPNDYFYIWLPDLGEVDEVSRSDMKVQLAVALMNSIDQAVADNSAGLEQCLQELEQHNWDIFARISLRTLARHFEIAEGYIEDVVADRKNFERTGIDSEYYLLASRVFPKLSQDVQVRLLEWISEGPSWIPDCYDKNLSEREHYIKIWKCRRFHVFREHLEDNCLLEYRELLADVGAEGTEPFEHPKSVGATWVGPTSPCGEEDLVSMRDSELIEYLSDWEPKDGWNEPSPAGLGRALESIIESRGARYSELSDKFIGLEPTYARSLFSGLEKAAGKKESIAWGPILKLANWVMQEHGQEADVEGYDRERDPGWGWTRKSIGSLLETGLRVEASEIPFAEREAVWQILQMLCEDPEPSSDYEDKYGGSNMSSIDLALNVVRGRAISAAIGYALWVKRHLLELDSEHKDTEQWMAIMPEVRSKLEVHLDPERDASLAVRSVYGQYFPQLLWLDKEWAREHSRAIFGGERSELNQSAWDAFIFFCRAHARTLEVLSPFYRYNVELLAKKRKVDVSRFDQESKLAQHLIVYFMWGVLDEQNLENLLNQFFENADDELRRQAINFAGDCIRDYVEEDREIVRRRLLELWLERRAAVDAAATERSFAKELSAFGSWFVSGAFDEEWAIQQLTWALRISGKSEPDDLVMRKLSETPDSFLDSSLTCLKAMIEGDERGWAIHSWHEEAETILRRCLVSGDAALEEKARNLTHWLGAKGYSDFRKLINEENSQADG